jgi:hypothetical protein
MPRPAWPTRTRGAASLVAEAINTARAASVTGLIVVRADSAFYNRAFIWACRRNGAHLSVTARLDPKVRATIAGIDEGAWTAIEYPNAVYDEQSGDWISDAEIAEIPYIAFAATPAHRTEGRLIVRRVRERNPAAHDQGELFGAYRYHAVFTDSPFQLTRPNPSTAGMPSSNRSSPTCSTDPWRTYRRENSMPMPPGCS